MKLLLFIALILANPAQAVEDYDQRSDKFNRPLFTSRNVRCAAAFLAATGAVLGLIGYNSFEEEGAYENVGGDHRQSWMPATDANWVLRRRSDLLSTASHQGYWVNSGGKNFGRIYRLGDRLVYKNQAGELLARSDVFSFYGYGYYGEGEKIPLVMEITDHEGILIGKVLEYAGPAGDEGVKTQVIITDPDGNVLLSEDADANLTDGAQTITVMASGFFQANIEIRGSQVVDPRLIGFALVMKQELGSTRGKK